jgi:cysteine desulfurase/selenocysteine lyase
MAHAGAVPAAAAPTRPADLLDVARIRADFPILWQTTRSGHPLVYLDNAATTQKPRQVIEAVARFYGSANANIHRGLYELSERATAAVDAARERVARFLGAASPAEIVFTRGTTEAINLVAQSWGRGVLRPGDEVLVTGMEHHSNLVPWQLVCQQTGALLRAVPITDAGELDLEAFDRLLGERTRLLALGHVSNALGTVNPVREAPSSWWTVRSPHLIWASTSRTWDVISSPARDTSCMGPPGSACCTAEPLFSPRCHPGRAAAI